MIRTKAGSLASSAFLLSKNKEFRSLIDVASERANQINGLSNPLYSGHDENGTVSLRVRIIMKLQRFGIKIRDEFLKALFQNASWMRPWWKEWIIQKRMNVHFVLDLLWKIKCSATNKFFCYIKYRFFHHITWSMDIQQFKVFMDPFKLNYTLIYHKKGLEFLTPNVSYFNHLKNRFFCSV